MYALTLGQVGPRSRDRNSNRQRTTIELVEVKGCSKGAGDESTDGEDRREGDHREAARITREGAGCSLRRERRISVPNSAHFIRIPQRR